MTKKIILSTDAPAPIGPYSQAIEVHGTLYVSGQIALSTFESGASIEEETDQVMKNLGYESFWSNQWGIWSIFHDKSTSS
jgi:2-iminobutanoate/2-iminopropanoate deaminase